MVHALDEVSQFSNSELVSGLLRLVKADRALSARLLVHLGEVDERKLYAELGYSSMFMYCTSALGMSEAEACLRSYAAKVGRRFPLVLERLGAGAVHLSAIKLLGPHLTAENHVGLLDRAQGRTKRQIEVLVAELAPKPDVPARMRKIPDAKQLIESNAVAGTALQSSSCTSTVAAPAVSAPPSASACSATGQPPMASQAEPAAAAPILTFALQSPRARASMTPLSPGRFQLKLTLGQEGHDTLVQLVELFRHQNPSGDFTKLVERALSELLQRTMKRRFGLTNAPERRASREHLDSKPDVGAGTRSAGDAESKCNANAESNGGDNAKSDANANPELNGGPNANSSADAEANGSGKSKSVGSPGGSRYIPPRVLREVYARDEGRCTFESVDGRRCTARGFLEVHHHGTTFARGGEATVGNLRLTCRVHNWLFAERDYGRELMREKVREAVGQRSVGGASCRSGKSGT